MAGGPDHLARAFRGELMPQDPNDEPASALLERIRESREAEKGVKRQAKTHRPRPREEAVQTELWEDDADGR
jgi:hypothetical protein